ncbi:hypothetical protein ACLOJK_026849 [Asimina triloba]
MDDARRRQLVLLLRCHVWISDVRVALVWNPTDWVRDLLVRWVRADDYCIACSGVAVMDTLLSADSSGAAHFVLASSMEMSSIVAVSLTWLLSHHRVSRWVPLKEAVDGLGMRRWMT